MSGIIINPYNPNPRTLFTGIRDGAILVRCALGAYDSSNNTASNTQTIDYTTGFYETFDTETFNGFLAPEAFPGQMGGISTFNVATATAMSVNISSTGTQRSISRKRYLLNYPLSAGRTIGNFVFQGHGTTANYNSIRDESGTGVTGTSTVTIKCGVLRSSNLTQISSETQSRAMSNTAGTTLLYIPSSSTATTQDGDRIYLDIELDANQTARSSGSMAIQYSTGYMSQSNSYVISSLSFTIA